GPASDEGNARAALPRGCLAFAQRPGRAAVVAVREPRPVIREENDERVLVKTEPFQRGHDLSGAPVDLFTGVAIEAPLCLAPELLARPKWNMWHRVCDVKKERLVLVLLDELQRPLGVPASQSIHV